ncbi:MAG: type II toxin-antitoxin system VapC family toxin [Pseudomonadota bacterium]
MKGLDTNVLVRFLVQDDPKQSRAASRYMQTHCTVDSPCVIGHIVICELAWVLERSYGQDRATIAATIEQLLQAGELRVDEPGAVWRALDDYRASNADFPDHLIARAHESAGCDITATFDRRAAKQHGFELVI